MFRTQDLFPGSKNVFDSRQKPFFPSEQQNLSSQHMFPAQLNWETFAPATMFPSLARPLVTEITCWVEVVVNCARFCFTGRHFKSFPKETTKKKQTKTGIKRK